MSDEIKRGKGRPPVAITESQIESICLKYRDGGSVKDAANAGGVGAVIAKRILIERGITIRGKKMA